MSLPKRPARVLDVTQLTAAMGMVVEAFLADGFRVTSAPGSASVRLELGNSVTPILLAPLAVLPGRAGLLGKYARVEVEPRHPSSIVIGMHSSFLANDVVPGVVATMQRAVDSLDAARLLTNAGPIISTRDVPPIGGVK